MFKRKKKNKESELFTEFDRTTKEGLIAAAKQIAETDKVLALYWGPKPTGLISGKLLTRDLLQWLYIEESPIGMIVYLGAIACYFDSFILIDSTGKQI